MPIEQPYNYLPSPFLNVIFDDMSLQHEELEQFCRLNQIAVIKTWM
jgi:hypothetical protein